MRTLGFILVGCAAVGMGIARGAPSRADFSARDLWFEQTFGAQSNLGGRAYLSIVFEGVADGLARGKSWRGTPFQLGDKVYSHGLAFNSIKHIRVHVGRPAARFVAEVGLENNDDTQRGEKLGQGSVTFQVLVAGKEVFASPVLRRKDGPRRLDQSLGGATEFEIRVGDGGDGRGWDQALWAEAEVVLEDGSSLRLQDLPLLPAAGDNPFGFSFREAGTNGSLLLKNWARQVRDETQEGSCSLHFITYREKATGLEVTAEVRRFTDFPAVEWVLRWTNTGEARSPLLEDIQALDTSLSLNAGGNPVLHWSKGAVASFDDFAPQETVMKPGVKLRLHPGGGRSSSQVLPFFNLEGDGGGIIAAIGWSGEWAAEFRSDAPRQVTMRAGMDHTHLVLQPSESIRTPRILLLFYRGDRWDGQNLLRQFILAHHRPQPLGQPLVAPITCGNWGATPAAVHLDNIRQIIEHQLPIEYYWIDAEWFGKGGWPENVGNWQVKTNLYPQGFKPLSDALRKSGRELMLWFEPERVRRGTLWSQERANWLIDVGGENLLLNLGLPEARTFLTDFISSKIAEFGLGCYRQDFNMDPLPFWRAADAPDRQGITEIRYIEGLYAFWDELLRRHPGLLIDNCASGGRRIDLETIGRATPFWRTDGPRDAIAHQCHSWGLLGWVPLSATSQDRAGDDYEFRSSMCSALCLNWWVSGDVPAERIPPTFPFGWAQATLKQYLKIRPFFYGDYYPLTGYSQAPDIWMGYQLNRPDMDQGVIVVLRRPRSPYETARFKLRGMDAKADYELVNVDSGKRDSRHGSELSEQGLEIVLDSCPGSAVFVYRRK